MYYYTTIFNSIEVFKSKAHAVSGLGRIISIDDNIVDVWYTCTPDYLGKLGDAFLIKFHLLSNKKKYLIVSYYLSGIFL